MRSDTIVAPTYSLKRLTVEALRSHQQKRCQKVDPANHHRDDREFSEFSDLLLFNHDRMSLSGGEIFLTGPIRD